MAAAAGGHSVAERVHGKVRRAVLFTWKPVFKLEGRADYLLAVVRLLYVNHADLPTTTIVGDGI